MAQAQRIAEASDWGDDGFEEAFTRFALSLNSEAELAPEGLKRIRSHVMKTLVARLRLIDDRKKYPAIEHEAIERPIIVTGQARSGTSYLNALLACDPRNLAPLHWQVWMPSPPPGLADVDHAPQIAAAERCIEQEGWQDPDVRRTHDYTATNASEDTFIQEMSFRGVTLPFFLNVPSFGRWLETADRAPAYRIQRKVMQAIQFGQKRSQWVVKGPPHLGMLDYLFGEFPDACVVVNHRDPVKAFASSKSMLMAHRAQFGNPPPELPREMALAMLHGTAGMLRKMIERRKNPAAERHFTDISYKDLERNPLDQVAKIYQKFDIEFTQEACDAMKAHIAGNRKGQHGQHLYDIREMGLTIEEVREMFRFYTDHFGIELEC
ncbi:sulfotransferase family protein [Novosphingobium malaysiense]|nr:sulfotransferase [Novosphingobium malaysiense]